MRHAMHRPILVMCAIIVIHSTAMAAALEAIGLAIGLLSVITDTITSQKQGIKLEEILAKQDAEYYAKLNAAKEHLENAKKTSRDDYRHQYLFLAVNEITLAKYYFKGNAKPEYFKDDVKYYLAISDEKSLHYFFCHVACSLVLIQCKSALGESFAEEEKYFGEQRKKIHCWMQHKPWLKIYIANYNRILFPCSNCLGSSNYYCTNCSYAACEAHTVQGNACPRCHSFGCIVSKFTDKINTRKNAYEISTRENEQEIDKIKYPYTFYEDGRPIEDHLVKIEKGVKRFIWTVYADPKAKTVQIMAGYMYAQADFESLEGKIIVRLNKISVPKLIEHLDLIAKLDSGRGYLASLIVIETMLRQFSIQKQLKAANPKEIEQLMQSVEKWPAGQGEDGQRNRVRLQHVLEVLSKLK